MSAPHSGADSKKVVIAALAGNGAIAAAKLVAALISGSATMMAEAVHSVADMSNQGLLLLGMILAGKRNPELYPLGRQKESYFWAFVVSLLLFMLGGVYAVYEGVQKLIHPGHEPTSLVWSVAVLVISVALELGSFRVAIKEFNRGRGTTSVGRALFAGKDPTIPIVLLEDSGAVVGLTLALAAVGISWLTRSPAVDAVGSVGIGLLLCTIGVLLARDTHSLLIGEAATPEMRRKAVEIARSTDGIEAVTQLLTMHLGPSAILAAFKVRFVASLSVQDVERVTDDLEARIRSEIPEMSRIFVEADGDYDARFDPNAPRDRLSPAPPTAD